MAGAAQGGELQHDVRVLSDIPLAPELAGDYQQARVRWLLSQKASAEVLRLMGDQSSRSRKVRETAGYLLGGWMDLLGADDLTLRGRAEYTQGRFANQSLPYQVESELSFTYRGARVAVSAFRGDGLAMVSVEGDPTDGGEAIESTDPAVIAAARLVTAAVGHTVSDTPRGVTEVFPNLPTSLYIELAQVGEAGGPAEGGPAGPLAPAA